jgi:hypothetical protein
MSKELALSIAILLMANCGAAQENLTLPLKTMPQQQATEARSVYVAACAAVQQEFRQTRMLSPKVTVVLGAEKDGLMWDKREVRLRKWDRYLFAQGVVMLAFDDLMPGEEATAMAKRALNWADATVNVQQLQR